MTRMGISKQAINELVETLVSLGHHSPDVHPPTTGDARSCP